MKWWERAALVFCVLVILGASHATAWQAGLTQGATDALRYCGRSGSRP
jgi:hypothetical protein